MTDIQTLVRPNIRALKPYSSARSEFAGDASVFLDANENPYENGFNRYPDPLQLKLKQRISALKNVPSTQIFLGNGSDEAIDLIYRVFCVPGVDNVVAQEPTYGMYQVCAEINDIEYRPVKSDADFQVDAQAVLAAADAHTKAIFLCSPNNPTGNLLDEKTLRTILSGFAGMVVIDEAYIDFASRPSMASSLADYPNLIILQTFSKAWGQASIRLGMAFASEEVIDYFNKVKYPYNVNLLTQKHALEILENESLMKTQVAEILQQRTSLAQRLEQLEVVQKVYPSDANFILAKVNDADAVYSYLTKQGIIVRNRNKITLCEGCLRITVGTPHENDNLIQSLKAYNR